MHDFDRLIDRRGTGSTKWQRHEGAGRIPCWIADMDFAAAPPILEALHQRVEHGVFGYSLPTPELRAAVVDFCARHYDWQILPDWLLWTPGLGFALHLIGQLACQPGESVMTATPIYPPFMKNPLRAQLQVIKVPLAVTDGTYHFDFTAMAAAMTSRCKMFLLCNPHNPVGRAYRRDELEELAEFILRHDLLVCSDEVHADLILEEGHRHIPFASLSPEIAERCVTLHAPSKTFNLPGLSCAWSAIANPQLRAKFAGLMPGYGLDMPALGLSACEAAYRHGDAWLADLLQYLRGNLEFFHAEIRRRCPQVGLFTHQATYLAWLDCRQIEGAYQRCLDARVAPSPGEDFAAPGFLRVNLGCPRARLSEIVERLVIALG